jgi:predicted Zn-dependent protease
MFEQFYPTLRLAEFRVDYNIKNYREVERIIAIARTEPESLSDDELNTAAANLDQTSPEFEDVVMAIVAKHPNDATANLNAGNVKMRRGELRHAEHYLKRAGTSAEADYARALLAIHTGNYNEARHLLKRIEKRISHAAKLLEKMDQMGV